VLGKLWHAEISFVRIVVDAGASLHAMIEDRTIDLKGALEISIIGWDRVMNSCGYSRDR
jgi:hypothetical protein